MQFSTIRITGILIGLVILIILGRRLRERRTTQGGNLAIIFTALSLIVIGFFPGIIGFFNNVFFPETAPGPRIFVLLIVAVTCLWFLVLWERIKNFEMAIAFDKTMRAGAILDFKFRYRDMVPNGGIIVVIPAFNEIDNLKELLGRFPKELFGLPVVPLVVNDGSNDGTQNGVEAAGAIVVNHPVNRGYGAAVRTGYAIAQLFQACAMVTMDADGQHDPAELETVLEPVINGEASVCVGSRMLGSHEHTSTLRTLGVWFFGKVINLLMGTNITDCSSGYRAFAMQAVGKMKLVEDRYQTAEMIIEAAKNSLKIVERPITIARRMSGESKKPNDLIYGLRFFKVIISTWLR